MDERLNEETQKLARSWMQHDPEMLRTYLVSGVEDPRINVQSILTRHALIMAAAGAQFERLMEHELRFALVLNWARALFEDLGGPEDLHALRHALNMGADNAEGIALPPFVSSTAALLPVRFTEVLGVPDYVSRLLGVRLGADGQLEIDPDLLDTFQRMWRAALSGVSPSGLSVLELACGSANDYRFLDAFGLARLIDYTGLDLCEKNIANAQAMFPQTRFAVGNAMAIDSADRAFDYCIVHDLFEHLSLDGMERALGEVCRVTRHALCLGFFNLHEGEEHLVQPLDQYHWNTLSVRRLKESLEDLEFSVQVLHVDTLLKWRFGCEETHNKNAYTFLASRRTPVPALTQRFSLWFS